MELKESKEIEEMKEMEQPVEITDFDINCLFPSRVKLKKP